ncbi:polyadenylate-binding protein, cytoplasmic and nuclear-like isoform X3 [Cornus florida]|uniref:polyadenylate-binding protein, cytoplasmic and nuclear-like isoform X3 n=2 Tax=Cornus florida TaxID=4283 RepID=UPI002898DED0|nr:polyadenylate-binding protein, cytoplasmic and nuclear-like isoform X3 [Cornus florida]
MAQMSQSPDHHSTDHPKGSEVFVGGLARTTTENKIREVFSTCGEITEIRMMKDQGGNSKGFCFVRFSMKESAVKAVKEKSGFMLEGKKIGVLPSTNKDSLFLGNLHKDWSADNFDKIIRQVFPDVVSVDLATPLSSGDTSLGQKQQNRGFAIVKFLSYAAAARAYRAGSKPEFLLAGKCHPVVKWAEEEPEVDPDELAKVKIAFVRNLPTDSDEDYLKELFEPLGQLDRVVLSKKSRSPVGFIHFALRSDLDIAIKEMNGKTVQGPNGGPSFKLVVEVARPIEKTRKRPYDDPQSKPASKIPSYSQQRDDQISSPPCGSKSKAPKVNISLQEPVVTDPYEAAVVSLPVAVKERLLRILRLGIATRFDMDIQCLTSLKELPESTAISVLDQFMLSGADRLNKGAYLAGLISRHQVDNLGLNQQTSNTSRIGDIAFMESKLSSIYSRVPVPAADPLSSRVSSTMSRYDHYTSRYSSLLSDYPLSSRAGYVKLEESSPSLLHRTPGSSTPYGTVGLDSQLTGATDRQPSRPQVRFDPFTGEPYKFDPFTGEPIRPESLTNHFGSPY